MSALAAETPTPRPRRRLGPGRLAAFSLLTLLLFGGLLEVGLQILAAVQGPQRHAEAADLPAPDPAAFRVVAVGDSWVYGAEAEPDEAFIQVFARAAAERMGRPVQVVNLGVSASNSSQALVSLARSIDHVEPDLVVALTGANNLLHDRGVAEAARIMGEDARMVPGLETLSRLRTVRLARLLWVNLVLKPGAPGTKDGASSGVGTAGLPVAPAAHTTPIVRLPWWDFFLARRWSDALLVLRETDAPSNDPRFVGIAAAWEALLLAHLGEADQAENLATRALATGGDEATAWEARAVLALEAGRPKDAMHLRAQAALAPGHPWIRERARGLVLLELEALEAAARWVLSVQRATPGELETLIALARLPGAVRTQEVNDLLFEGPRGLINPWEYFEWHLASSGMLDRATAALGDPDPVEPMPMMLARARAAELGGAAAEASERYAALVAQAKRLVDLDRARAGVLRTTGDPAAVAGALGASPAELLARGPGAATALGLVSWFGREPDCDAVLAASVAAVDAGALPQQLERTVGACVSGEDAWAIGEMGLGRTVLLDRAALIGGEPVATIPAPTAPAWAAIRDRDFAAVPADAAVEWRALGHALAGEPGLARALIAARGSDARDLAVLSLAEGLALRKEGRELHALVAFAQSAEAPANHDPWARLVARGLGDASAQRWTSAQSYLLSALSVAPGQLEILQALADVPDVDRLPGTNLVLGYAPAGRLSADQWVDWYLAAARESAAELALRWSWAVPRTPSERVRMGIAEARVRRAQGDLDGARAGIAASLAQLETSDGAGVEPSLLCEALTLRLRIGGRGAAAGEIQDVLERCPRFAPAWATAARARVGAVPCQETATAIQAAIERGADPDPIMGWMPECMTRDRLLSQVEAASDGRSDLARQWTRERIQPPAVVTSAGAPDDILVRQLDAMNHLARGSGAAFVALTYPFPSGHHARVGGVVRAGATARGYPVLDLYGVFATRFSADEWRGLRTPEDHVNADGYELMGSQLAEWAASAGLIDP